MRPAVQPVPLDTGWMSLAEAARILQAAERGSDLDRLSRGLSESDACLGAFWAQRVAKIGVPVHGRRIMSTRSEIVPAPAMLTGRLLDDATRLEAVRHQPLQDFCELRIRRSDFDACLAGSRERADADLAA